MTAIAAALSSTRPQMALQWIAGVHRSLRDMQARRRSLRAMRSLDIRTLKDIGIGRSEIMSVVYGVPDGRIRSHDGSSRA